jgi:hypothetical protein
MPLDGRMQFETIHRGMSPLVGDGSSRRQHSPGPLVSWPRTGASFEAACVSRCHPMALPCGAPGLVDHKGCCQRLTDTVQRADVPVQCTKARIPATVLSRGQSPGLSSVRDANNTLFHLVMQSASLSGLLTPLFPGVLLEISIPRSTRTTGTL